MCCFICHDRGENWSCGRVEQKTISRLPQRISGTVQVVKTRFGRSLSYHLKPMVTKPVTKEGMVSLIFIPLPKLSMKKLSEALTEEKSNAT